MHITKQAAAAFMRELRRPPAELLLELADSIQAPKGGLLVTRDLECLGLVKLALEFAKRPMSFRLRAMVENWSNRRIVREMY